MKIKAFILLMVFLFIIAIIVSFISIYLYRAYIGSGIISYKEINVTLNISNRSAFNLNTDKMHFGSIKPGDQAIRRIKIRTKEKVLVHIEIEGTIEPYLYVNKNDFVMEPYSNETLEFRAIAPKNARFGNYEGTIKIYFKTP